MVASISDEKGQQELVYDWDRADKIHMSHNLKTVGTHSHAVYCSRCGAWNKGGPLKALKKECSGIIADARTFQHRLLQCGVVPCKGSKIPSQGRKRKGKET